MKIQKMFLCAIAGAICAVIIGATSSSAALLEINFTGMNLRYDGTAIYDAGNSNTTASSNPAQADPLITVDFLVDGSLVNTITTNSFIDLYIPDVVNIPSTPNTVFNITTVGNPGFFDLLFGSPIATEFLALDLNEVTIFYNDVAGIVQFTLGAAVAQIDTQNLPFGLQIGEPVAVTFSANIQSRTSAGGFITSFTTGSGSGNVEGPLVPEPATCGFMILAGLAVLGYRRVR